MPKERRHYGKVPMERGERFVWGPGDVEVTYSPSGNYPPKDQRNEDQDEVVRTKKRPESE